MRIVHLFDALDFLAEAPVTKPSAASSSSSRRELHSIVPPRRVQLIRRYGLYSSRTKGRWPQMPHIAARAPEGWRASHLPETPVQDDPGFEPLDDGEEVTVNNRKRAWARLLAKVYEIDPLVCPKCGWEDEVQFRGRETAGSSAKPNCSHLRLSRIRSRYATSWLTWSRQGAHRGISIRRCRTEVFSFSDRRFRPG